MAAAGFIGDGASVSLGGAFRRLWRWTPNGRASRSEFWYSCLLCLVSKTAGWLIFAGTFGLPQADAYLGILLSLMLAVVSVQRLHDVDRSGWWIFLAPTIVGLMPLTVWLIRRGTPYRNRFELARSRRPLKPMIGLLAIDDIEELEELRRRGMITEVAYKIVRREALRS